MSSYVPVELRRLTEARAEGLCEYCLIHEDDTFTGCQVDHVVSEKHGGLTDLNNLSIACACCNRSKGSDIGSVTTAGQFCRFFNSRIDRWSDHFVLNGFRIVPRTDIGEVTAHILGFNTLDRLLEREELARNGRYPSVAALCRM